jgi:hypothetical protein
MKKIINLSKNESRGSQLYAIDTGVSPLSITNNSGIVPVLGIRLNAARHSSRLSVTSYTVMTTGNDEYLYLWLLNPTLDTPPTWIEPGSNALNPGTVADVFIGDGTQRISGGNEGVKVVSGYETRRSSELNNYTGRERTIGISGGVSNELFLCVVELTGTFDFYASLMRDELF